MSIAIIRISKVPVTVKNHDFEKSIHPEEVVMGYCTKQAIDKANIETVPIQLYLDDGMNEKGAEIFLRTAMAGSTGMFYFSTPNVGKDFKALGRLHSGNLYE